MKTTPSFSWRAQKVKGFFFVFVCVLAFDAPMILLRLQNLGGLTLLICKILHFAPGIGGIVYRR